MSGSPAPTRMVGKLVDLISGAPLNSEGTFVKCLAPSVPAHRHKPTPLDAERYFALSVRTREVNA